MISKSGKNRLRLKRHKHIRRKISDTAERPRLSVFRSNENIYAQLVDGVEGVTLASASINDKNILAKGSKMGQAAEVGRALAEAVAKKNIKNVVFDKSGYLYRGRVQAPAGTTREDGLEF